MYIFVFYSGSGIHHVERLSVLHPLRPLRPDVPFVLGWSHSKQLAVLYQTVLLYMKLVMCVVLWQQVHEYLLLWGTSIASESIAELAAVSHVAQ